jgi:hypothetical protein
MPRRAFPTQRTPSRASSRALSHGGGWPPRAPRCAPPAARLRRGVWANSQARQELLARRPPTSAHAVSRVPKLFDPRRVFAAVRSRRGVDVSLAGDLTSPHTPRCSGTRRYVPVRSVFLTPTRRKQRPVLRGAIFPIAACPAFA